MEKLELKHIAPYLPYELKCVLTKDDIPKRLYVHTINEDVVEELRGIKYGKFLVGGNKIDVGEWNFKPLLRPLSDLTQEIEHNGERFVPIIELFKFHNKNSIRVFPSSENYELDHYSHCVIYDDKNVFGYSNYGAFVAFTEGNNHLVVNQNELFAKLYEWHFDVFGLIEKGLAVRKD